MGKASSRWMPSDSSSRIRASPSLVAGAGQRVVLHQHGGELPGQEGLPADGEGPGAVLVDDAGRLVLHRRREPLVEDVLGQRDVVVGREDLGAGRQADRPGGVALRSFGGPKPSGGYVSVPVRAVIRPPSPSWSFPFYFDVIVSVNGSGGSGAAPGRQWGASDMTEWDSTVDFVIVGSGGGGMVAALTADAAGASALVLEKQELVGGSTGDVRRGRLGPGQPGHAGRRHPGLLRGRHGPLRSGRRRRRSGLVVRASPRLPHRRSGDGLVPPGPRRRLRPLPRLQRLLLERQGRRRRGPGDRTGPLGRSSARRLAREAAAGPGPEPRPGGDDERSPFAVQLQPQHRRLHRVGPGRDPHLRRPCPPAGAAHQRRVADRPDARHRPRPAGSRCGPRPRSTT